MFEKEAEEYTKKKFSSFVKGIREIARIGFKDGAEFGYNLAKEEIDKPVDIDDIIAWKEIVLPKESE